MIFAGVLCEKNVDDCIGNACRNGGVCEDGLNRYTCKCGSGWTGQFCEQVVHFIISLHIGQTITHSIPLQQLYTHITATTHRNRTSTNAGQTYAWTTPHVRTHKAATIARVHLATKAQSAPKMWMSVPKMSVSTMFSALTLWVPMCASAGQVPFKPFHNHYWYHCSKLVCMQRWILSRRVYWQELWTVSKRMLESAMFPWWYLHQPSLWWCFWFIKIFIKQLFKQQCLSR